MAWKRQYRAINGALIGESKDVWYIQVSTFGIFWTTMEDPAASWRKFYRYSEREAKAEIKKILAPFDKG